MIFKNIYRFDIEFEKCKNYEVVCPNCKRWLKLSEEDFEEREVISPDCGEKLEFAFDDEFGAAGLNVRRLIFFYFAVGCLFILNFLWLV